MIRGIVATKAVYVASRSLLMSNDLYLALAPDDITRSYSSVLGQLVRGMLAANKNGKSA